MKNSTFAKLASIVLLAGTGLQAMAAVEVEFVHPEKFIDYGNRWGAGIDDGDQFLKELKDALVQRGEAVLTQGQDMKISVTDVNRAGDVHPFGRNMEMIRVVKPLYRPSIDLSYVITEGGKTVREGKATMTDINFMDRFNRYFRSDALYYEKPMIDDWFKQEFGKDIKVARQ
ncbi:DUF3016 domain-containing protein [Burkholderiaceae bacterium UC74_6]